jgi:hypothetical protein
MVLTAGQVALVILVLKATAVAPARHVFLAPRVRRETPALMANPG